jgi:hypothetical protein
MPSRRDFLSLFWKTAVAASMDIKPKDPNWEAYMKWDDGTNHQHDWSKIADYTHAYFTATVQEAATQAKIMPPTTSASTLNKPAWIDGTEGDNEWPERRYGYSSFNEQPDLLAVQNKQPVPEGTIHDKDKPR